MDPKMKDDVFEAILGPMLSTWKDGLVQSGSNIKLSSDVKAHEGEESQGAKMSTQNSASQHWVDATVCHTGHSTLDISTFGSRHPNLEILVPVSHDF